MKKMQKPQMAKAAVPPAPKELRRLILANHPASCRAVHTLRANPSSHIAA